MGDGPASATPACRACGGRALEPVLSLGDLPLANALLRPDQLDRAEPRFPLDVVFCPTCSLVQLGASVSPETLFGEYTYFSSFSETFKLSARLLAERLVRERGLGTGSLVVEVASNDGYLLQQYQARGVGVLGLEPARNVAAVAQARGVPTLGEFFDAAAGARLAAEGRRADVLHAHNVLAHVPDLNGFILGLRHALKDDGVLVIEVPWVREMVLRREFDTIYHEHLSYFSLVALTRLLAGQGLGVEHVEEIALHGGSLRVFAVPSGRARPSRAVAELLRLERSQGVDQIGFYRQFAGRVRELVDELHAALVSLRREGRRVAAYGAAAKGTVLLNCLALPPGTLDFVADRSPHKQGLFVPGVRLPVRPPEALLEEQPDDVLLLAWNLETEVLAQQLEYRRRGGRFIVPIPEPRLV